MNESLLNESIICDLDLYAKNSHFGLVTTWGIYVLQSLTYLV